MTRTETMSPDGTDGGVDPFDPVGHSVAAPEKWPWLPRHDDQGLARHPYCEDCGAVKVVGRESGVKLGTLVNVLGKLRRKLEEDGRKLTETHTRLIVKRLKARRASDDFATPRSAQFHTLAQIVHEITGLDLHYVQDLLRSC